MSRQTPLTDSTTNLGVLGSWRTWAVGAVLFLALSGLMFGVTIPAVTEACGAQPPDVRFSTTHAEVDDFLTGCGAAGRNAYRQLQVLDLAYPMAVGLFLTSSLVLALRRHTGGGSAMFLAGLGLLAATFDYVENTFAWVALTSFPASPATNGLLGIATSAKSMASWGAWTLLLGILAASATRWLRRRTHRPVEVPG